MYDFMWGEAFLYKVEQFPHRLAQRFTVTLAKSLGLVSLVIPQYPYVQVHQHRIYYLKF